MMLIKSVFNENHHYIKMYRKIFRQTMYLYKCCIIIELTFLKVLTLVRKVHQKSVLFVTTVNF